MRGDRLIALTKSSGVANSFGSMRESIVHADGDPPLHGDGHDALDDVRIGRRRDDVGAERLREVEAPLDFRIAEVVLEADVVGVDADAAFSNFDRMASKSAAVLFFRHLRIASRVTPRGSTWPCHHSQEVNPTCSSRQSLRQGRDPEGWYRLCTPRTTPL